MTTNALDAEAVGAVADLARKTIHSPTTITPGASLVVVDGSPYVTHLDDQFENPAPDRTRGTTTVATLDSFASYVNRHLDEDRTTVWLRHDLDTNGATAAPVAEVVAVIDDQAPGEPSWGEHRVVLDLTTTPEWRHWLSRDGLLIEQMELAEHFQDGVAEIREPDAATMLEIAQSLQVRTDVDFKSHRRTSDGQIKFQYEESQAASAGVSGALEIPEVFQLRLAAFEGTDPVEMEARLRWRALPSGLKIGYRLQSPHRVLRDAVTNLHKELLGALDDRLAQRVYRGCTTDTFQRRAVRPVATFERA